MSRRPVSLFRRIEPALEMIDRGSTPLETTQETANFLVVRRTSPAQEEDEP
jgi:hypothetical protein